MTKNLDIYCFKQEQMSFEALKMNKRNNPEYIRAITPLILAAAGCLIGVMVIFSPKELGDAQWTSGIGLEGTAITGAAGLAQSNGKNDSSNNE